jgi:phosphoglycerate dehydrogenase-like enzyme
MAHLVWIPGPQLSELGPLPEDFTALALPDDIGNDPNLGEVEFVVVRLQDDLRPYFPKMHSLKIVQTVSAGVDSFVEGFPSSLTMCSARGTHDIDVAEWVVGAILAGQRHFPFYRDEQKAERWTRTVSRRTRDSTVFFLGYGSIAQAVEARLAPFGVRILRAARHEREGVHPVADLLSLVAESDVVIVLCPLTPETVNLVDAEVLAAMRDDALLINVARGAIVDTDALVAELETGRIRAVLDSTEPEPLPPGHPLFTLPGVFVTPHVSGATKYASSDVFSFITEQIHRYAHGEPLLNIVHGDY